MSTPEDPVLFCGLDIGIKRDTSAFTAVCPGPSPDTYALYGHRIWFPPVSLVTQVEPFLLELLAKKRVASLLFDPYQFQTTAQRLHEEGYGHLLVEVNQQTEMINYANTLHSLLHNHQLVLYPDGDLRQQFSWCAAQHGERGWRIVKQKQSKQIDAVVSLAMALAGAVGDLGHAQHPSFDATHTRSAALLP
jgi:phage terminase large subunit-like protein